MKKIVLAGGCFWGVQEYFDRLIGVKKTSVGYIDGNKRNPSYQEVCNGIATHTEAMEITYDENETQLTTLLDHFFRIINPFSRFRQGNDIGKQYRTGIYFESKDDEIMIIEFMKKYFLDDYSKVQTEVKENKDYDLAEEYHQDYLKKNKGGYCHVDMGLAKKEEIKS